MVCSHAAVVSRGACRISSEGTHRKGGGGLTAASGRHTEKKVSGCKHFILATFSLNIFFLKVSQPNFFV